MPGMPHDPANRLAVHATALQQPDALMNHPHHYPHHHHHHSELSQQARASPVPDATNWAADFTRFSATQRMRSSPNMAASSPSMQTNQQQPMQMNLQSAFSHVFGSPMYGGSAAGFIGAPQADFDKEMSQWMSTHGSANMREVDAAMDQMARELQLNEATLPADAEATATTAPISARYTDLESPEIANLSLQDVPLDPSPAIALDEEAYLVDNNNDTENDNAAAPKTKSAVSEAAERLLDTVQHENGEKWQNSVFLSLMRDFRDGRKDIVDNEIRDTDAQGGEDPAIQQQPTT